MVADAVEQGRRELLALEDLPPFTECQIGRDHRRASLVALGQKIEQQFSTLTTERHEAELVDDQECRASQPPVKSAEEPIVASFQQVAHEIGGPTEDDAMASTGGFNTEPDGQ